MAWKQKFKSLFIVDPNEKNQPQAQPQAQTQPNANVTQEELDAAAKMSTDELLDSYEVPKGEKVALPPGAAANAVAPIDFQSLYDQLGIPNTDEVEMLEKFLAGLDSNLPQASRIAAAKAFLGAIGKSTDDVLTDAARKIKVVRAVEATKHDEVEATLAKNQQEIDALQKKIDEHRSTMEDARKSLESVRAQCTIEEGRLQGARVFFGHMEKIAQGK